MKYLFLGLLITPAVALLLQSQPAQAACSDFGNQGEAQAYFNRTGDGSMDRDHDGVACENLAPGMSSPTTESNSPPTAVRQAPRYEQDRSRSREVDPNAVCPYSNAEGYNATVAEEVNLRSGPSTESGIITTLSTGTKIRVHSGQGENERLWGWLTTEDGQDGWASMRYVACID